MRREARGKCGRHKRFQNKAGNTRHKKSASFLSAYNCVKQQVVEAQDKPGLHREAVDTGLILVFLKVKVSAAKKEEKLKK